MKAITNTIVLPRPASADEEIERNRIDFGDAFARSTEKAVRLEWSSMTPQKLKRYHEIGSDEPERWYNEDPGFHVESNTAEIEVVP